jgi:ketosteroid isomerase-like protein
MNIPEEIQARTKAIADGVNNGDSGLAASSYTADAAVLPPGAPRMDGREAIKGFWQGAIDMGLTDVTIEPDEVEILGDVATDVGTIGARLGDAALTGKYIVIWKNGPDGWLIHRDTWNFDA